MASIPDNYEINVAKKKDIYDKYGTHFCKIQLSETIEAEAEKKLKFFRELFGDEYNVTMVHWVCRGQNKPSWD